MRSANSANAKIITMPNDFNQPEIVMKIKKIIMDKLGLEETAITEEARFTDDLGVDSLDLFEFIMEIEKEFRIRIPDEEAEKLRTVADVIGCVTNHTH